MRGWSSLPPLETSVAGAGCNSWLLSPALGMGRWLERASHGWGCPPAPVRLHWPGTAVPHPCCSQQACGPSPPSRLHHPPETFTLWLPHTRFWQCWLGVGEIPARSPWGGRKRETAFLFPRERFLQSLIPSTGPPGFPKGCCLAGQGEAQVFVESLHQTRLFPSSRQLGG